MTEKEYRALKRPSVSLLKMLADPNKTPAHFQRAMTTPFEETDAMRIGTAVHMATLEPLEFQSKVASLPFDNFRTKAAKEARALAIEKDMIPLLSSTYDDVLRYKEAIVNTPEAAERLARSEKEKAILWECEGVELKSRLDILETVELPAELGGNFGIVSDVKTCADASLEATNRAMHKYGYFVQAGAYALAHEYEYNLPCNDFYFIWIEKDTGFCVVRRVEDETLQLGKDVFRHCCRVYKTLDNTKVFPSYPAQEEQALSEYKKNYYFELLDNQS